LLQKYIFYPLNLCLKTRFYSGVFWILAIFSRREFRGKSEKRVVLYLSKPIFNDDIEALKKYGKHFNYIKFPRPLLRPILEHFIPNGSELNDANYHLKTKDDEDLEKFREFWDSCLIFLRNKLKFDLILSGNFVYVTQQEMFRSAKKIGLPTIVLYKEGMFPADRNDHVIEIFYKNKIFLADKVLFYNQGIRDILIKSKLPGLTEEKTAIVGVPRFDYLVKEMKKVQESKKQIVLFAFDPTIKSEYLMENADSKIRFEKALFEFQSNLVSLVAKRTDFNLIIKSKSDPKSKAFVEYLLKYCGCSSLPKNIFSSHSLSVQTLIEESIIIAGYSSTTLIEALTQDKCVMCPDVFDYFKEKSPDMFQGLDIGIQYISTTESLENVIMGDSGKKTTVQRNNFDKFLKSMIYRLDGKSTQRVEKEMLNLINT